ncbi:PilN domain-containing protein [Massilia sp. GCM10023247]|uniref:PilN domain-containing protein n=1 Tax=Massilia sp. GCM10023247 TaxID=3252643 RepID=UPI0036238E55
MKRVRLDFAAPGLRRSLYRAPHAWAPLLAGLVVCAVALSALLDYREAAEEVEAQRAALQARAAAPALQAAQVAARRGPGVSEAQAAAANAAIMQLNLPWRALHDAVRGATPASVALLALEPDSRKRVLRISAEAKSSDDMLAYVEALGREEWFGAVTLVRHEVVEQDPNRPLRFQVDAGWGTP